MFSRVGPTEIKNLFFKGDLAKSKNTKLQAETQRETKYKLQALKFKLRGELPMSQKEKFMKVRCTLRQAKNINILQNLHLHLTF